MIKLFIIFVFINASLILAQEYDWQNNHIRIGESVMLTEQFKPVKGYEGLYEISNFGEVKSLPKAIPVGGGGFRHSQERILKNRINKAGYCIVALYKYKQYKNHSVHTLVWDNFGDGDRDGRNLLVDHKDENKQNNNIGNLQLLTHRDNISKTFLTKVTTSKYTGVSLYDYKKTPRWRAGITINGKQKTIGYFDTEYDAHLAYQRALDAHNI